MSGYLTDIEGIKIGHAQDYEAGTGCTVILCPKGAIGGVDVRGGAPGTRETDLMAPENLVEKVNAIYLSGGSAFGLDGASGVMQYLSENGIGFDTGAVKVPIVPAAVIFDLDVGNPMKRPDFNMGYEACINATEKDFDLGNVGAGTGATVGKYFGNEFSMKGGLGTSLIQIGELKVGALAVVNALGDVIDPETGNILAGALNKTKTDFINTVNAIRSGLILGNNPSIANTTIGAVATNARLSKAAAHKVASMAHDGLARAIRPVHTMFDGDTVFCLSIGDIKAEPSIVGILAAEAMAEAIISGIKNAEPMYGRISFKSFK
ncbi:peptidase [Tepidanaerobacter syntrophicus]|uniref:P1 family peptidase n=1 Tax=Tepidanaerobacter syntrophicus TaxID=224999 RepID=UPI001BD32E35|nr:P1 family peptidase [Tepidanaerobacter syntrophicus]GLI50060.1 peptidase [Tepidanaerobacter syntrophicus]